MLNSRKESISSLFEIVTSLERKWANEWNSRNEIGYSKTHILLLDLLLTEGPKRPSVLAERLHITTGGVTVLTTKLIKAGYVKKTQSESDRRASQLEITTEGTELLTKARTYINDMIKRMFGMLNENELHMLHTIFSKCMRA